MASAKVWNDILAWQEAIDKKDAALARNKPVRSDTLPPVRDPVTLSIDKTTPYEGLSTQTKAKSKRLTPAERAEAEKAKGNACFQAKKYREAVEHYSRAIDLDPTSAVYFINRAMAYLRLEMYLEAEQDCTRGLQLQPQNVKALWRRGIARRELGRVNDARRDFENGLVLEPSNKTLLDELEKLKSMTTKTATTTTAAAAAAAKAERTRLQIETVDDYYNRKPSAAPEPAARQPTIKSTPATATTPKATTTTSTTTTTTPLKITCPRTNLDFERDWKMCRQRGPEALYQYLQCIPPSQYVSLFKSSLESDQFEQIIEILDTFYTRDKTDKEIFDVLQGLSRISRINMLVMFMGSRQKQALERLFNRIKGSIYDPSEVAKTARVFGVKC